MSGARYAVFGDPISHSWSPRIHAAFAAQTGEDMAYEAVQVPAADFEAVVRKFFAQGGAGLNITLPHKQAARALAQHAAEAAAVAGAANTLWCNERGEICCDNTDGRGLVRDLLVNHGIELQGRRVLLLGAGGAARSVLGALIDCGVAHLHVANRTVARAAELRALFPDAVCLSAGGINALADEPPSDVVISALSAGLHGALPELPASLVTPQSSCYDMIYSAQPTAFQGWARDAGARQAFDGLGMLVEQAAESFRIWRNVQPATREVIRDLRSQLADAAR